MMRVVLLAALAVAIWFLGAIYNGMPEPRPLNAPATEFSSARADATLGRLLGPQVPHPVSSAPNHAVRDRVRAEFAALHVKTSVYRALGCNGRKQYSFFACGTVEDVIAEVAPGEGKAIVMLAHYDSVPAGPGASDDQSGVATILETVRALQARGLKTKHPIIAVITDGEEAGLLGAAAFVDNPDFRARVGMVVNVEARGNQGPSLLFQTSAGDGPLIDLYARSVPEYATSSLFAVIYKLLPNDTDLTVFLDHGLTGYNFAFSGNVSHYHTPLDRRENLSPSTLQQHGDNLLGTVSGLMQADFASLKGSDDIYLTVFGHLLPRLPAAWAIPLALIVIVLLVVAAFASRGEVLGLGRRLAAFAIPLGALIGSAALGWLLHTVASLVSGQPDPSYAHPVWLRIALALGVATVLLLLTRVASARLAALSIWSWFAGLGLVTAIFLPGMSPYFLFPALIAAIVLIVQARLTGRAAEFAALLAALPALIIWLSLASAAEQVQGLSLHPLITITFAFGAMTLIPLLAPHAFTRCAAITGAIALVLAVAAGFKPAYSPYHPERLSISFVDDHVSNQALWMADPVGAMPQALRDAAPFSKERRQVTPLTLATAYAAPAGKPRYEAPSAATASTPHGKGRTVTLSLHASDQANRVVLVVPKDAGLVSVTIDGKSFAPDPARPSDYGTIIACMTDDCRDKTVTLEFATRKPVTVTLGEQRYRVPADAAKLLAARPNTAIPSQSGDTTIVFGRLTL